MSDAAAGSTAFDSANPVFPPRDLASFLSLCEGRWLSLRSRFVLGDGDSDWHTSERGELVITALQTMDQSGMATLRVQGPEGRESWLWFHEDGGLSCGGEARPAGVLPPAAAARDQWHFWSDGSLELVLASREGHERCERIWFTKPNLRLRSTTAFLGDGSAVSASFCSEIRRLATPPAAS